MRSTSFSPQSAPHPGTSRISGRNQLLGKVAEVAIEGLLAKVVLSIGDQRVTAIITADAARELALRPGDSAVALIKATEVMISGRSLTVGPTPPRPQRDSQRFCPPA